MKKLVRLGLAFSCACLSMAALGRAQDAPRLVKRDGRFAMMVDGKPFLMLGAQINNSSSWASTLPQVWPALEAMHVNTVEAPVYWEQMEPEPGKFDFSGVDLLVNGAREHKLKLVILWFGTWKNGQNHYVPEWMKSDTKKYPREISAYGKLLDVMSPNSAANLEADKKAFAALMRHVHEIDAAQHTVIMIQVENESGSVGAIRDYSAAANKLFAEAVPGAVTKAMREKAGTWTQMFGADADERFAAYSTAKYIGEVAAAGKREHDIPMYCNVWITYPKHELENRDHPDPGQEYPSGGPQQGNIDIWKAAAPAIDALAPDFYSGDATLFREVLATYGRPDNPVLIPETGLGKTVGRYFFYALGHGTIGFSPFGVDFTNWTIRDGKIPAGMDENFALIAPIEEQVARLNLAGKVQTAVEEKGMARQRLHFSDVDAVPWCRLGIRSTMATCRRGRRISKAARWWRSLGRMSFWRPVSTRASALCWRTARRATSSWRSCEQMRAPIPARRGRRPASGMATRRTGG